MVRFLLSLLLLCSLLRVNDVQAACYAGSWANGAPIYGSLFVDGTTTLAQCQALACQYYPGISTSCPSTCQVETQTQTQSCPTNYSGQVTQSRTKTCPDNTWQPWTTIQNTCTPNSVTCTYSAQTETRSCPVNYSGTQTWKKETNCPSGSYGQPVQTDWFKIQDSCVQNQPTCQISSQQQTLACQTGFTGSITQTRSSTCPDPYGQPVFGPWVTTQDTCKKSVNNPTNPVSPLNPASTISAPTIQSSPVTAPTPNSVLNSATTPTASTETSQSKTDSQTTSSTQVSLSPPPKGKVRSSVGLALSLELFVKPGLQQPNLFPEVSIVQNIPNVMWTQDTIMLGLISQTSYNQPAYNQDLGFEQ